MNMSISRKDFFIGLGAAVVFLGAFDWIGISNLNQANMNRSKTARSIYCAVLANQRQASERMGLKYQAPALTGTDPCAH